MSDARFPTPGRTPALATAGIAGGGHPKIIQGGMGVAVSNWSLARAVALRGQLGVVSGTGIDSVMVRRLQDGDVGGHVRRAMEHFPFSDIVKDTLRRYFLPDGRPADKPYLRLPLPTVEGNRFHRGLMALAGFTEVFLAKEDHDGPIGINLLTKIQLPNMATLYGAMLAGVNHVLMGAGIPRDIPGILDELSQHRRTSMRIDATVPRDGEPVVAHFDPAELGGDALPELGRPDFFPIISTHALASILLKKATGAIQGFIVEAPTAGGHNAPPRGSKTFDERGQPVYGDRDRADLEQMRGLGLPFWLAGSSGSPEALAAALDEGAAGVQVGTIFAYCAESGFETAVKQQVIDRVLAGDTDVLTDAKASPTGFPFKVVTLPGSLSESEVYEQRTRVCDLGYLREVVRTDEGKLAYRCASEPVADYVAKGGDIEETVGRKCLCNALMANVGIGQVQKGQTTPELPLVTSGDDLAAITRVLKPGATSYTAAEVVDYLLGQA
ncbi:MAG TPA: nitronate monooxygenase [Thermoleophilia bacterium]|nr:nitronate monooxygenase [Thermoleophilia bacterium]